MDLNKLTADLRNAIIEARKAIEGVDDGGTCNMDSPILVVSRASKRVEETIEAAGIGCWYNSRRKGYVMTLPAGGQGATRTKAAEVARKSLEAAGYQTDMWYQMD